MTTRLSGFAVSLLALVTLPLPCVVPAAVAASSKQQAPAKQQQALHMLDRFSFGPTPGEAQQVAAEGVYRWFAQQLHPAQIDDSALDARLAEYPSTTLPLQALFADYPSPGEVRQVLAGRRPPPTAEPESIVWQSQIQRVERKREDGQKPSAAAPPVSPVTLPNTQALLAMAPPQRYQALLALPPGSMPALARALAPRQRFQLIAGFTPSERDTTLALVNPRLVVVNEQESARLLRDIYSRRQVQQVMAEFWLNHFNISTHKNQREPYYLAQFQDQVVAPHALGRFEDLLDAVAQSPAMLLYLDNVQSVGPDSVAAQRRDRMAADGGKNNRAAGINENYGRELMELHTVGVNGGYTQQDVIEAARVLTGWTVAPPQQGGGFRFNPALHEPGDKTVMGHVIHAGGQQEGLELLHILASSPATARMLSTELAVRFVGDAPAPVLVNRMVATYLKTDGDISAVLTTLVRSPQFRSAANTGNKVKTPLDYVVSAVRATDANVTEPYRLVSQLRVLGMPLTGTQEPNGYSMKNDAWTSTSELVERLNFALALASDRIPGVVVSMPQLVGPLNPYVSPALQEAKLEKIIFGEPATPQIRQAVLTGLKEQPTDAPAARLVPAGYQAGSPFTGPDQPPPPGNPAASLEAGLLLGSPEFQRR